MDPEPSNRHPREPDVTLEENDTLGFVLDFVDMPDAEGVDGEVNVQLKPSPGGYQISLWWREDGKRKQNDIHATFDDPRDAMRAAREGTD